MGNILIAAGSIVIAASLLYILAMMAGKRTPRQISPMLQALKAAGIKATETEQRLCSQRAWVGNDSLLTSREQQFYRALLNSIDRQRWLLCPQVRVADIVTLAPHIKPGSKIWWQLFRMVSQWHCDIVVVDASTFAIVAAVELDDASHLKKSRIRRDILLEEVLRQAGIPLLRDRSAEKLVNTVKHFLLSRGEESDTIPSNIVILREQQATP
ncbi:DUF2726 domain-containing protein [Klebsiella sp. BIGb0407]|uniref:DUF2726 domain-containing protein n=1 Tax=Klebsiella sp. BIGb0407 TaxID=2940603 RepID=UPI0021677ABD|nr:DUF2726 domain-containing protein [Klebsiella sp. BIGb0407]MCS3434250.1 hypothetical protein [Klebsiella sp. BIGb0407]